MSLVILGVIVVSFGECSGTPFENFPASESASLTNSILAQAARSLGLLESSMTVFSDSACLQENYPAGTLSTSIVSFDRARASSDEMIALILRAGRVVRFKCKASAEVNFFKSFGCRLLTEAFNGGFR